MALGTEKGQKSGTCKLCGLPSLRLRAKRSEGQNVEPCCSACAAQQGLCVICRRPQDTPGFKTCTRCRSITQRQLDRIEARTGIRNFMPEWMVRQMEHDKKFGAELAEKFKKDLANG